MLAISKETDLNWLVLGGQLYWVCPFSKGSLVIYLSLPALLVNQCDQLWIIFCRLWLLKLKVHLHYGENRAKLVGFKEKKKNILDI